MRGGCVSDFHHANDHWTEEICPAAICTTNHLQGRPSGGCLDPKTKRCVCVLDLWETSDDGRTQAPAHRAAGVCPAFPPGPHQPGCTGSAVGVCRPRGYVFGQPCNASGAESGPVQRRDHGYEDGLFTDRVLRTLAENEGQTQPLLAVWAPHGVHVSGPFFFVLQSQDLKSSCCAVSPAGPASILLSLRLHGEHGPTTRPLAAAVRSHGELRRHGNRRRCYVAARLGTMEQHANRFQCAIHLGANLLGLPLTLARCRDQPRTTAAPCTATGRAAPTTFRFEAAKGARLKAESACPLS